VRPATARLTPLVLLAACGSRDVAAPPSTPIAAPPPTASSSEGVTLPSPPCGASAASTDTLLGFSVQGTHGMDFSESLTVQCDGLVVLDAPRPWTTELEDRPGRYTTRLDESRLASLRSLASRLGAPVGTPSLPPQGAEVFVVAGTTPPLSRPLRVEEGPADGEAAAVHASLTAEVIATLPPAVRCALEVSAEASAPLHAGVEGMVVLTLRNPYAVPLEVELRSVHDELSATVAGASVLVEGIVAVMDAEAHVLGFLEPTHDGALPLALTIPPHGAPFAALRVLPTEPGSSVALSLSARVRGCPGMTIDARQTFEAGTVGVEP
jgi:hypothetical protein